MMGDFGGIQRALAVAATAAILTIVWPADTVHAETATPTPVLTVLAFERPPYYVQQPDRSFAGLVAGPVTLALDAAGIPFRWDIMPASRHMAEIARNRHPVCAVGWFRNENRERFAKYTAPIFIGDRQVALTRTDNTAVRAYRRARDLAADETLVMGRKRGFSYGPYFDDLITRHGTVFAETAQPVGSMLGMLLAGRFDYMLVDEEEAIALIERRRTGARDLAIVPLDDMPPGRPRHLACSEQVPDSMIARINRALRQFQVERDD